MARRIEPGLAALSVGALALRLYRLDAEPLWFDEAYTALTSVRPLVDLVQALRLEGSAPLHYVLLHFWCLVFGDSEFSLRLPSALAGAAAIPLLFSLGTRMFSRRVGWIAAVLAATSPLHVHFSQEARMYPMVALGGLWVLSASDRLLRDPRPAATIRLALALTFGIYLHYFFLLLLPLLALATWTQAPRRTTAAAGLAVVAAAAAFAPWMAIFWAQASSSLADWIVGFWEHYPLALAVPWSLQLLGPGGWYPPFSNLKLAASTAPALVSLVFVVLALFGCGFGAIRRWREGDFSPGLTLAATLTPLVVALAASLVRSPVYLTARYDLIAWAPYQLLVAAALGRVRPGLRGGAIALWIATSLYTLAPHFTTAREPVVYASRGDRIAERLLGVVEPGELVIYTAGTRTVADYYLRDHDVGFDRASHPLGSDDHLGWIDARISSDAALAENEARRFVQARVDPRRPASGVCVVSPTSGGTPSLLGELRRRGFIRDQPRSDQNLMCLRPPTPPAGVEREP